MLLVPPVWSSATSPNAQQFAPIMSSTLLGRNQAINKRSRNIPDMEQLLDMGDLGTDYSGHILSQNIRLLQIFLCSQTEDVLDEEKILSTAFKTDCFSMKNTDTNCHVFRLLFQCYDFKEAEVRFRDVWPIYDKKTDSLFRRVVANWLKEIIPKHSGFFNEIKLEALGFLLVNSSGDRFVQLLECFVDLVLYRVMMTSSKELPEECTQVVHAKPKYFNNSAVTSRQILVLMEQRRIFQDNTTKIRIQMLKDAISTRKREQRILSHRGSFQLEIEEKSKKIDAYRQRFPELHSNEASVDGSVETLSYSMDAICRLLPLKQQNCGLDAIDSSLVNQLKTVGHLAQTVGKLFDKYKSVWHIIGLSPPQERVLDITKLYITSVTKSWTLGDFIETIKEVTHKLLEDERLKQPVPPELLVKFKKSRLKFNHLQLCWKTTESRKLALLDYPPQILLNPMRENSMDWGILSEWHVPSLNNTNLCTTSKEQELISNTGYTPRLMNFLQPKIKGRFRQSLPANLPRPRPRKFFVDSSRLDNEIMNKEQKNEENIFDVSKLEPAEVNVTRPILNSPGAPVLSPVTVVFANSQKPPLPNVRLRPSSGHVDTSSVEVKTNVEITVQSDISISTESESETMEDINESMQDRMDAIFRTLNSMTPCSASNCIALSNNGGSTSRRSSLVPKNLFSVDAQVNKSLLSLNWSDEKGIMEVSFNEWENDSSDDE